MKPEDACISVEEYRRLAKKKGCRKLTWKELYDIWAHKFKKPEEVLAIQVSKYLHDKYPDLLWWHTQNEGRRGVWQQSLARLLGVKPGVPDIFIPVTSTMVRPPRPPLKLKTVTIDPAMWKNPNNAVMLFAAERTYNGFFCELKAAKNKPTKIQSEMMKKLTDSGYYCCVCYTLDEFIKEWTDYVGT